MYGAPTSPPNQETIPLRKATNARKDIKLAMILATKNTALAAPWAAASRALASFLQMKLVVGLRNYLVSVALELPLFHFDFPRIRL